MTEPPPSRVAPLPAVVAEAVLAECDPGLRPPVRAARVGGGYSWRTYALADADGRRAVVRLAPPGGTMSPYDPRVEARALRAARGSVPAPRVLGVVPTPNRLGAAYGLHEFAEGEVRRLSAVAPAARAEMRTEFATALGRLHAGADTAAFEPRAAGMTTTDAVRTDLERTVDAFARSAPCRHPGITIGLRWLATHLPAVAERPRLCHGDFRLHNLMWDGPALVAVLDWERAWVGDPMVDVAFTRRFSGWCAVAGDAVAAYEAASGVAVDESRVAYGDRYEQVRSYSSASRGWHALGAGRDDALALYAIGEAGRAGAWALVDLLTEGPLVAAGPDGLDPAPRPAFTPGRGEELATAAAAQGEASLAAHLAAEEETDAAATSASVEALRRLPSPVGRVGAQLASALSGGTDAAAWARAYTVLTEAAVTGGPELLDPLRALGRRHTDRRTLLPHAAAQRQTPAARTGPRPAGSRARAARAAALVGEERTR